MLPTFLKLIPGGALVGLWWHSRFPPVLQCLQTEAARGERKVLYTEGGDQLGYKCLRGGGNLTIGGPKWMFRNMGQ